VERLLVKDLKSDLQSRKCPLHGDPEAKVSEIEVFIGFLEVEPCRKLIEVVPCEPEGWEKTRAASIGA
jgi:hypothetical protein